MAGQRDGTGLLALEKNHGVVEARGRVIEQRPLLGGELITPQDRHLYRQR